MVAQLVPSAVVYDESHDDAGAGAGGGGGIGDAHLALGSLVQTLEVVAARVAAAADLPRAGQVELLRGLINSRDVLASLIAQAGTVVEASGAWRQGGPAGARNYGDWLGRLARTGLGAGRAQQAKQTVLTVMPDVKAAATRAGSGVTDSHVSAVARVMETLAPETKQRLVAS